MKYRPVLEPLGFRRAEPLPSERELAQYYAEVYFQTVPTSTYQLDYSEDELAHKRARADLTVHVAKQQLLPAAGKLALLELGFGEGYELAAARRAGFDCVGVDFGLEGLRRCNPQLEDVARAANPLEALHQFVVAGRRFHACVLKNVIEHVREPASYLRAVRSALNPGGLAIVTLPNDYSDLQLELLRRGDVQEEYWFAPPQHLQYFNLDNFPAFAGAAGYEVVDLIGDFPIELFLLHPGSNYARDPALGRPAHKARIATDLLLARGGLQKFADVCRAFATTGLSRTFTAFCRPVR
ncbi:MAG: class I SAM-dependent methyltransferase [Steroidobacteraceae bacterium]